MLLGENHVIRLMYFSRGCIFQQSGRCSMGPIAPPGRACVIASPGPDSTEAFAKAGRWQVRQCPPTGKWARSVSLSLFGKWKLSIYCIFLSSISPLFISLLLPMSPLIFIL